MDPRTCRVASEGGFGGAGLARGAGLGGDQGRSIGIWRFPEMGGYPLVNIQKATCDIENGPLKIVDLWIYPLKRMIFDSFFVNVYQRVPLNHPFE